MSGKIRIDEVAHTCILVDDVEEALDRANRYFVLPSTKVEESTSTARLKGREVGKYKLKMAKLKIASNFLLEFLQIVEGKSVEQTWLRKHGRTVHHIAVRWERKGIAILQENHGRWIYMDTEEIFGMIVELIPIKGI
jgi:hypothetical protein